MIYFCCTEQRRALVKPSTTLNGIDYLEVYDPGEVSPPDPERQKRLFVHFLNDLGLTGLAAQNFSITGGESTTGIVVTSITYPTGTDKTTITLEVNPIGDFSPYTLSVIPASEVPPPSDLFDPQPPAGFDPILSSIDFSFKVNCPSNLDCQLTSSCATPVMPAPDLDYTAKDFTSFRQLMLDRVTTLVPGWDERHSADIGVTLIELIAYVGDYLSYQQDAVATEAYLETARSRVSVRRHARLVDYFISDGCNARTWIQVLLASALSSSGPAPSDTTDTPVTLAAGTQLLTLCQSLPPVVPEPTDNLLALSQVSTIFSTMQSATLYASHGTINFYTWGDANCCLPLGATRATLLGTYTHLKAGDILIFEEVLGPLSGKAADADPNHRCAVRLIDIAALDASNKPLVDPLIQPPATSTTPITEIAWHPADALPFPVCLSSSNGSSTYNNISVARGNIVLADHGRLVADEVIGQVPQPILATVTLGGTGSCSASNPAEVPPRFRPSLSQTGVTQACPYPAGLLEAADADDDTTAASAALSYSPADALPAVVLSTAPNITDYNWSPEADLLSSQADDSNFVLEIENDGASFIRFGDDQHGERPTSGTVFHAQYRVGNGTSGNIGSDAIAHIVSGASFDSAIVGARNPLAAWGGVDSETSDHVRQSAPNAFQVQERAVTVDDYATIAMRYPEVSQAAATQRWTGSWFTIYLSVQRTRGQDVDSTFISQVASFLENYRMTGQDLQIGGPTYVALEIALSVCVQSGYIASQVESSLYQIFSNGILPSGQPAYFNPANFGFGQPVYLSPIIAAAQSVPGVASVTIVTFEREATADPTGALQQAAIATGYLEIGMLEIAQVANDPSYPEHGSISFQVGGGI